MQISAMNAAVAVALGDAEREKLMLFCAILTRLEIRLDHDTRAVRRVLGTPLAALNDRTPLAAMAGGIDSLRAVHAAVGDIAPPEERWWRVARRG